MEEELQKKYQMTNPEEQSDFGRSSAFVLLPSRTQQEVIQFLEQERGQIREALGALQKRARELDHAIGTLRQLYLGEEVTSEVTNKETRYMGFTARRAILDYLNEINTSVTLNLLAQKLKERGLWSKAARFSKHNLSTMLSMMKKSGEVESVDTGWQITEHGKVRLKQYETS